MRSFFFGKNQLVLRQFENSLYELKVGHRFTFNILLEANVSIVRDHMTGFSQMQVHCIPGEEDRLENSVLAQNKISGFLRRWVLRPSSDAVLHMCRIECKCEKPFVLPHQHTILLISSEVRHLNRAQSRSQSLRVHCKSRPTRSYCKTLRVRCLVQ